MKNFIIAIFFFSTFNLLAQTKLTIGEDIYPDSLSVLDSCKWIISDVKFQDLDGKKYDVFLDIEENEVFMIFRKKNKFIKVWF